MYVVLADSGPDVVLQQAVALDRFAGIRLLLAVPA